ncbi:type 1 fimbrial protein [Enterobacter sp. UNJFSC 003]|uniref:type 1 fimbrial protein n=1 Tax=Enterobacter sp. UNJFSC 003 TaxID=3122077 RepID=UPI002E991CF9|nr:type 1 fimbrial protein [Serratia liquefaciens]
MTKSTAFLISGFGLMLSAFISPVYSATVVNGGVIHFRGAIVADPCVLTPQRQQIAMSCPENNRMQTRMVSYDDALNGRNGYPEMASISMTYLNPQKTLAVVQVDYR